MGEGVGLHNVSVLRCRQADVEIDLPDPIQTHDLADQLQARPLGDQVSGERVAQDINGRADDTSLPEVLLDGALDGPRLHTSAELGDEEVSIGDSGPYRQIGPEGLTRLGIEVDESLSTALPPNIHAPHFSWVGAESLGELDIEAGQDRCLRQPEAGLEEEFDEGGVPLDVIAQAVSEGQLQTLVSRSSTESVAPSARRRSARAARSD